ncbi:SET domain-containing protein [Mycena indigotica]|uniref:SET domain-containing protein n=1 Tax=Mycena indigotica TaxID=2126181 RepID=A0A8H6W413_9AGAR|nr:SET domain-containing protein [Mycena indigotica]KAF7302101.1 SET domain-containing protein [Mycena indigotica]
MTSRLTPLLTVAGISVCGLVAYAIYFDYKRRTDTTFRKQLRMATSFFPPLPKFADWDEGKQKKRVDKSLAQSREALEAASHVSDDELREALKQIEAETKPGPDLRENYFMTQVAMGEQLATRGEAFHLTAALSFYRALAVYPSPPELLAIYQKTVPDEIVKLILRLINLDVSASSGADLGIDDVGDVSPTRGPPSETSSQEWDKPLHSLPPLRTNPLSNIISLLCAFALGQLTDKIGAYYEVFPPKSANVTIQSRPEAPVTFGPEKSIVLTKDVAAGDVIYKENPMLTCLDYDLQHAGTHCIQCFCTITAPETLLRKQDGILSFSRLTLPLPAIVELGGLAMSPATLDARREAQAHLSAYLKKDSRAGALLVAQFIARQLTAVSKEASAAPDFAGADIAEYRIEDHVERWTTGPLTPPEQEYELLVSMLKTTLPGLEAFLAEDSHKSLLGKLVFNAFGVCYGEKGRDDRPPSTLRPEETELTRTPFGTAHQVGTAVYSISSYLPHSCAPNVRPVFASETNELTVIANKDMKKGDELSMAYVIVDPQPEESIVDCRLRRRKELARGWKFACQCERCIAEVISP